MQANHKITKVVVISDTHVPDRAKDLHPDLINAITREHPALIIHAGDICVPQVLNQLAAVAPVRAVRGNRDFVLRNDLDREMLVEINGVPVGVLHGHGGWTAYFLDKLSYVFSGYREERYFRLARSILPRAKVIIFGHTHRIVNKKLDSVLYFNSGSAAISADQESWPSFGVLTFDQEGQVQGKIVPLRGYQLNFGRWTKINDQERGS
jgi:putative phosphoesterase